MSTTPSRSRRHQRDRRHRRRHTAALTAGLVGLVSWAAPSAAAAPTAAPTVFDANSPITAPVSAIKPAVRLAIQAAIPIFPMQVEPTCIILDNFGDGRSSGRTHLGTDILADTKVGPTQAVYAVVNGTLGRQVIDGEPGSTLSGNGWRLTATNSTTYYVFMHLSSFAPGLSNGSVVEQGDIIGYVGDTGNPGPGNYHLHFEYHPASANGSAINAMVILLPLPAGCILY